MENERDFWERKFSHEERKSIRKERKRRQIKGRSRFKKTDQSKHTLTPSFITGNQISGIVQAIFSLNIQVITKEGVLNCTLKGTLKKETVQYKRPLTVGDRVFIEKEDSKNAVIVAIEKRSNILSRSDSLSEQKRHILAANIDYVFITMSVCLPPLKPNLIDRYLIAAIKGNLPPVIIINKIDLLEKKENEEQKELCLQVMDTYQKAGFVIFAVSVNHVDSLQTLKAFMKDKVTVFSGQSGVGKSSIINTLCSYDLKTGQVIRKTKKGMHTTTKAILLPTNFGGYCVDTPGVKSFGVWNLEKEDVKLAFPDFQIFSKKCKYDNCYHDQEPNCSVKKAIGDGKIATFRYDSYMMLLDEAIQKSKR